MGELPGDWIDWVKNYFFLSFLFPNATFGLDKKGFSSFPRILKLSVRWLCAHQQKSAYVDGGMSDTVKGVRTGREDSY